MLIAFYIIKIMYICVFSIWPTSYSSVTYLWIHKMYICAYICTYVHMSVCMYVCVCMCMYVCMYVMGHVNCIRIKYTRQFSQILEEVTKSEKAVRSYQKN